MPVPCTYIVITSKFSPNYPKLSAYNNALDKEGRRTILKEIAQAEEMGKERHVKKSMWRDELLPPMGNPAYDRLYIVL